VRDRLEGWKTQPFGGARGASRRHHESPEHASGSLQGLK